MNWWNDLIRNPFFMAAVSSWMLAQILKTVIYAIVYKQIDLTRLVGDGGMPSGHSATVTSMAVMAFCIYGAGSFEFAVSAILAIIVCHDAMGVRLETGKQAVVLNEIMDTLDIFVSGKAEEMELKEFVGHTPLQVMAGIAVGVCNAVILYKVIG